MLLDRLQSVSIPAAYGLLMLTLMAERHPAEHRLLAGTGLRREDLAAPTGRMSLKQYGLMLHNALAIDSDTGFAFEMGLRSQVTRHGFIGFGLMSCATLREAIAFAQRYFLPRVSIFDMHHRVEGDTCIVALTETHDLGSLRPLVLTIAAVEACNVFARARGADPDTCGWQCEVWCPFEELPAYARFRAQLPPFRFHAPAMQIRFPAALLDAPIATADPISLSLIADRCEQELAASRPAASVADQVIRGMVCRHGRYPELGEMAAALLMSERTLKRRLHEEGTNFNALRDAVRHRESLRLLAQPELAIKQIAEAVGYTDPSNFARAFVKWTGLSPRAWRERRSQAGPR